MNGGSPEFTKAYVTRAGQSQADGSPLEDRVQNLVTEIQAKVEEMRKRLEEMEKELESFSNTETF